MYQYIHFEITSLVMGGPETLVNVTSKSGLKANQRIVAAGSSRFTKSMQASKT